MKLSANQSKPAHKTVFNANFKTSFGRKPNQIPSLGFRTSSDLEKMTLKRNCFSFNYLQYSPWLLATNFSLYTSLLTFSKADSMSSVISSLTTTTYLPMAQKWIKGLK